MPARALNNFSPEPSRNVEAVTKPIRSKAIPDAKRRRADTIGILLCLEDSGIYFPLQVSDIG